MKFLINIFFYSLTIYSFFVFPFQMDKFTPEEMIEMRPYIYAINFAKWVGLFFCVIDIVLYFSIKTHPENKKTVN